MENLELLDVQEIKILCKKYDIGVVGDKKTLIKKLKYFLDPIQDVLNTHPGRKLPQGKTIIGVKTSEKENIFSTEEPVNLIIKVPSNVELISTTLLSLNTVKFQNGILVVTSHKLKFIGETVTL